MYVCTEKEKVLLGFNFPSEIYYFYYYYCLFVKHFFYFTFLFCWSVQHHSITCIDSTTSTSIKLNFLNQPKHPKSYCIGGSYFLVG